MIQLVWHATLHKTQRTFTRDLGYCSLLCHVLSTPWKMSIHPNTQHKEQYAPQHIVGSRRSLFSEFGNIIQNARGKRGGGDGTRKVPSPFLYPHRGRWPRESRQRTPLCGSAGSLPQKHGRWRKMCSHYTCLNLSVSARSPVVLCLRFASDPEYYLDQILSTDLLLVEDLVRVVCSFQRACSWRNAVGALKGMSIMRRLLGLFEWPQWNYFRYYREEEIEGSQTDHLWLNYLKPTSRKLFWYLISLIFLFQNVFLTCSWRWCCFSCFLSEVLLRRHLSLNCCRSCLLKKVSSCDEADLHRKVSGMILA